MLTTDRLILRDWRQGDLAPFSVLNADAEVMKFFPSTLTSVQSAESLHRFSKHITQYGFGFWAVELRATGDFIGFIGMQHVPDDMHLSPAVEIGWRLMKTCWGNGYAPEGARAALAYAYSHLQLEEVVSFTSTTNKASQRVMEKIGMKRDRDEDFEHPKVAPGSSLLPHVLYRHKATDPIAF
ncbi:MAG: GNAT family N-acetyltransferase [Kordiimonadaceae bacterium]|nr:GNAT family N-acetyltransferase [Kordiimonadaceae bacterium]